MGLMITTLRAALIIILVTSMEQNSSQPYWIFTDGISHALTVDR